MKRSLSNLQREKPREPFILTVNPAPAEGEKAAPVDVEFVNPKSLHWTKLTELDDLPPAQQIAAVVPDPDHYRAFQEDPEIDGEALEWVMGEWRTHFGLGDQGNSGGSTGS